MQKEIKNKQKSFIISISKYVFFKLYELYVLKCLNKVWKEYNIIKIIPDKLLPNTLKLYARNET